MADTIARRVREVAPEAKILNRPAIVLERYPLLRQLAEQGLNDFSVYRLDSGEMPKRYPVFVRCEDDCKPPDTQLLGSEEELKEAIDRLAETGTPLKRRIAVEFCAAPGPDGYYRKYGVFKVGSYLIPQNILRTPGWYVKLATREASTSDPAFEDEQLEFVRDIPHAEQI